MFFNFPNILLDDGQVRISTDPLNAALNAGAAVAGVAALAAVGVPAAVGAAAVAATSAASSSNNDLVEVDGYYRNDGTYVRGHNRTHPDGWEGNNFTA